MFKLPENYLILDRDQKTSLIQSLVTEFKLDPALIEDICDQLKIKSYKNASEQILNKFLEEIEKRINFGLNLEKEKKGLQVKFKKLNFLCRKSILKEKISDKNLPYFTSTGIELYNKGDYENALIIFEKICNYNHIFFTSLLPQMEKCNNVINKSKSLKEKPPSKILKILGLQNVIRCKYCGKYTNYIDPNEPTFGIIHKNNCSKCGRMYFAPSFYWDSWGGMEYIIERHSVPDEKFYEEYKLLKTKEKKIEQKNSKEIK